MPEPGLPAGLGQLWEWRRRVTASYAAAARAPDPARGWAAWRAAREALFRDHPQSPAPGTARLPFFDYDPALRFTVPLAPAEGPPRYADAGADGTVALHPFARTIGLARALGRELTLFWIGGYGGGAFLPFQDATSGGETYGGGRYLLDTIKGADLGTDAQGRTVLDFNFAYNPSCCYSDAWTCPLSPPENRLLAPVRGGEKAAVSRPAVP